MAAVEQFNERFPLAPTKCPVCAAALVPFGEQTLFVPGEDEADFTVVILQCTATPDNAAHAVLLTEHVNFAAWDQGD